MKRRVGLFSKYHVRTKSENPLDSGTVVLRPFNRDGTVRDPAAVLALNAYAEATQDRSLAQAIIHWIVNPTDNPATTSLNIPDVTDAAVPPSEVS